MTVFKATGLGLQNYLRLIMCFGKGANVRTYRSTKTSVFRLTDVRSGCEQPSAHLICFLCGGRRLLATQPAIILLDQYLSCKTRKLFLGNLKRQFLNFAS